jgi:DNA-binding NarL/FixJ family response regulator
MSTPNANDVSIVLDVELLAWISASQSEYVSTARYLGAAAALWNSLGTSIEAFVPLWSEYSEKSNTDAVRALGEHRFRELFEQGRTEPHDLLGLPSATSTKSRRSDAKPLLTRREREVANLVSKGLTNKAIAAALVLSPRTVDGHVERVFTKIGVKTRAQVAVWIAEHGTETNAEADRHDSRK